MLNNITNLKRNIIIGILITIMTVLGHFFIHPDNPTSYMWPAFGLVAMFFYFYRKKVILSLILGTFIGQMIIQLVIVMDTELLDILIRISFTLTTILESLIFVFLYDKLRNISRSNYYEMVAFVISGIIATFLGGVSIAIFFQIYSSSSVNFIDTTLRWMIGDLSGLLIFGSVLYFIINRNVKPKDMGVYSIIYVFLFLLFNVLLFTSSSNSFNYQNTGYMIVLFYAVGSVLYGYPIILLNNLILVTSYQLLYLDRLAVTFNMVTPNTALSLNLMVFSVSTISILVRYYYEKTNQQNDQIVHQNEDLQEMINSTHKFISLSGRLFGKSENLNKEYLKEIFNISCVIFSNFDSASCFIVEKGTIKFIDAVTYDIDKLNQMEIPEASFSWSDSTEIIHNVLAEKTIKDRLAEDYDNYSEVVPPIKESIYLYFKLSNNIRGGISFDIFENSSSSFSKSDFEIYKAFHTLVYSIYQNAMYTTQQDSFKSDLVWSLVRTLTYYDEYTVGHSQEVAEIALELSKRLNLSEDSQFDTYWAGVVHDIGKIGIPAEIINKTGSLTDDEYDLVKKHPMIAYDILKVNDNFINIAEIVRSHHERVDGNGYPDNKMIEDIPFESQILCVADAVSSMGSNRPYSPPMSIETVCQELRNNSNKQFNVAIVKEMLRMIQEGWLEKNTSLCRTKKV